MPLAVSFRKLECRPPERPPNSNEKILPPNLFGSYVGFYDNLTGLYWDLTWERGLRKNSEYKSPLTQ